MSTDSTRDDRRLAYSAVYFLTNGARINVSAIRGTQATGRTTGNPLDATEFGQVTLGIDEPGGEHHASITITNLDDADAINTLFRVAKQIADSRDVTADKLPEVGANG